MPAGLPFAPPLSSSARDGLGADGASAPICCRGSARDDQRRVDDRHRAYARTGPGGAITLTARESTREPNGTSWFRAEFDLDGEQVWFRTRRGRSAGMPGRDDRRRPHRLGLRWNRQLRRPASTASRSGSPRPARGGLNAWDDPLARTRAASPTTRARAGERTRSESSLATAGNRGRGQARPRPFGRRTSRPSFWPTVPQPRQQRPRPASTP